MKDRDWPRRSIVPRRGRAATPFSALTAYGLSRHDASRGSGLQSPVHGFESLRSLIGVSETGAHAPIWLPAFGFPFATAWRSDPEADAFWQMPAQKHVHPTRALSRDQVRKLL
jgi:hypothetical protein